MHTDNSSRLESITLNSRQQPLHLNSYYNNAMYDAAFLPQTVSNSVTPTASNIMLTSIPNIVIQPNLPPESPYNIETYPNHSIQQPGNAEGTDQTFPTTDVEQRISSISNVNSMEQELYAHDSSTDRGGYSNNDVQLLEEQDDSSAHTSEYTMQHENKSNQVNSTSKLTNETHSTPSTVSTPSHEMLNPSIKLFEDEKNGQSSVSQQEATIIQSSMQHVALDKALQLANTNVTLLPEAFTVTSVNHQNIDLYDADDSIQPSGMQLDKVQEGNSAISNESIIQQKNNQPHDASTSKSTEGTTDALPSIIKHNLPQLPPFVVPQTPHITSLRALLLKKEKLKNTIHLHGPRGSGLTTLANLVCQGYTATQKGELLEDSHKELEKQYPDGIYWVDMDATTHVSGVLSNLLLPLEMSVHSTSNWIYIQPYQPSDKAKGMLIVLDKVTEEQAHQLLTIQQNGTCNLTFLVISTLRQHLDDCENYTIGFLDTCNAQALLYATAELVPKKVDINMDFKRGVKKLLALCDGHTLAIATFGAYISHRRDNQHTEEEEELMNEKVEKLYFIVNCLSKGDLTYFKTHHNGKTIKLEDYLRESIDTCVSEPNFLQETIVKMALFPGGLCIPKHVLTWIWHMRTEGETDCTINFLYNNFLLSEEENGSFSIQHLFYRLMLKQCDQQWLSAQRLQTWDYLFHESFGSFCWVKKTIERMGIGILQQDLQYFDKAVKNSAQAAKVTAYQAMLCGVWTVDDFTNKLDEYFNFLRTKLDELLARIIELLRNLNANMDVEYLEHTDDLEVVCNYIRDLNTNTWESPELDKTKASIIHVYSTFIFFNGLRQTG